MHNHLLAGGLPLLQVAVPLGFVIGVADIGEDQIPLRIGVNGVHKFVGNAHGDIGVGDLAHLALRADELDHVRVPAIENEHQRAATRAALFNESCHE